MAQGMSFRQTDERHLPSEVQDMLVSPSMDLLLLSNKTCEVLLYRLSQWQKVWTKPSPAPEGQECTVRGIAWRPDGKAFVVSYSTLQTQVCDVENATALHEIELCCVVTTLAWCADNKIYCNSEDDMSIEAIAEKFLPPLPAFHKSIGPTETTDQPHVEDPKRLQQIRRYKKRPTCKVYLCCSLSVLLLGLENGSDISIKSLSLSPDLRSICAVYEEDGQTAFYQRYDSSLLAQYRDDLFLLSKHFGIISTLYQYLEETVQNMRDAWEDILLEMDNKLVKFAEDKYKLCSGSVSNDFLRLLMYGTPSNELTDFLLMELTERGLKKLGHSIETSYSNVQRLVLKHLQQVIQSIVFHLSSLRSLSAWKSRFGPLGLDKDVTEKCYLTAGSCMLKASELQQVIDGSMRTFKAFFRWLYVVIQRLSEETIPPEFTKMTQQDLMFVAKFLKENFTEKVGQYLQNSELTNPPDHSANTWDQFLAQHSELLADKGKGGCLFRPQYKKSLVQMKDILKNNIDDLIQSCSQKISEAINPSGPRYCISTCSRTSNLNSQYLQFHSRNGNDEIYDYLLSFSSNVSPSDACVLSRISRRADVSLLEAVKLRVASSPLPAKIGSCNNDDENFQFLDVQYYNETTLSCLLASKGEEAEFCLAQLPIDSINQFTETDLGMQPVLENKDLVTVDAGPLISATHVRRLENMRAARLAISGARQVAAVLFSSLRRVRIFYLDAEDDDEDDDDEIETTTQDVTSEDMLNNQQFVDGEAEDENSSCPSEEIDC